MVELRDATVHITDDYNYPLFAPFAKEVKILYSSLPSHEGILGPASASQRGTREAWMIDSLKAGKIAAWLADYATLRMLELENCDKVVVAPNIRFGMDQTSLLFQPEDVQLANDLKAALVWFKHTPAYSELERRHMKTGEFMASALVCSAVAAEVSACY